VSPILTCRHWETRRQTSSADTRLLLQHLAPLSRQCFPGRHPQQLGALRHLRVPVALAAQCHLHRRRHHDWCNVHSPVQDSRCLGQSSGLRCHDHPCRLGHGPHGRLQEPRDLLRCLCLLQRWHQRHDLLRRRHHGGYIQAQEQRSRVRLHFLTVHDHCLCWSQGRRGLL
jgi:hypothetical protein